MSEMLANHYFMIRDFEEAVKTFERVITLKGSSKSIQKKMIICYVRTMQIEKALEAFIELAKSDIDFITDTKIKADDCPCPEIISEIENDEIRFRNTEKETALGILWLYCDIDVSLNYFTSLLKSNPNNDLLTTAYNIINNRAKKLN